MLKKLEMLLVDKLEVSTISKFKKGISFKAKKV